MVSTWPPASLCGLHPVSASPAVHLVLPVPVVSTSTAPLTVCGVSWISIIQLLGPPSPLRSLRSTPSLLRLLHIKALTAEQSALIVYTSTIHLVTPCLTRTNHLLSLWPPSKIPSQHQLSSTAEALQTAINMQHRCCICDVGIKTLT